MIRPIIIAATAAAVAACGANQSRSVAITNDAAGPAIQVVRPATAQSAAEAIKATVPEVTDLIAITEENDANNMIGRSNGYVAATVIVDSRIAARAGDFDEKCSRDKPGIVCGAGVEQWPDAAATQARASYIKAIQSSMPFLGTEYQTVKGNLLLRVSGKLRPSEAQVYQAAFMR